MQNAFIFQFGVKSTYLAYYRDIKSTPMSNLAVTTIFTCITLSSLSALVQSGVVPTYSKIFPSCITHLVGDFDTNFHSTLQDFSANPLLLDSVNFPNFGRFSLNLAGRPKLLIPLQTMNILSSQCFILIVQFQHHNNLPEFSQTLKLIYGITIHQKNSPDILILDMSHDPLQISRRISPQLFDFTTAIILFVQRSQNIILLPCPHTLKNPVLTTPTDIPTIPFLRQRYQRIYSDMGQNPVLHSLMNRPSTVPRWNVEKLCSYYYSNLRTDATFCIVYILSASHNYSIWEPERDSRKYRHGVIYNGIPANRQLIHDTFFKNLENSYHWFSYGTLEWYYEIVLVSKVQEFSLAKLGATLHSLVWGGLVTFYILVSGFMMMVSRILWNR